MCWNLFLKHGLWAKMLCTCMWCPEVYLKYHSLGYLNSTVLSEEKLPIKSQLRLGCGSELPRNPSVSVSPLLRCQIWATMAALNVGSGDRAQFFPSLSPVWTNWVLSTTSNHCFFNIYQPRNISFDLPLIPVFLLNYTLFSLPSS